jgi:2-C-methyl-D-erythritol 4-phosphate cytidylyltransferase
MSAIEATTCVKIVDRETMKVKQCLDRKTSWLGQTPHAFKKDIILRAYEKAIQGEIYGMDDCELVRKTGVDVVVVEGEWTNKKVTLQADLDVIRSWSKYV